MSRHLSKLRGAIEEELVDAITKVVADLTSILEEAVGLRRGR
jgi:hypothetical protein